jgi:hypothetical protein
MYLFTRSGRFGPGSVREAMGFVATVTEKVNQISGLEIHAWIATLSPELGTVSWATFVEHLEQLEQANDKLALDDAFAELTDKHAHLFVGPLEDSLAAVVHGGPQPDADVPAYVTVARAVAANGKLGQAMADGVEIAVKATEITGLNTSFLASSTGPYGGCAWTTGCESIAQVEESEAKLMADAGWLSLIDRIGTSFTEGASQSIYRRLV